jgi:fused signal recognition particle receptor
LFESLKKKFSGTIGKITDKVSKEEKEAQEKEGKITEVITEVITEEVSKEDTKKSTKKPVKKAERKKTDKSEDKTKLITETESKDDHKTEENKINKKKEESEPSSEEKSGLLSFVRHKTISEKDVDDILFELELSLLEGDVALEVAEEIIKSVKEDLVGRKIKRRSDVAEFTKEALKKAISKILDVKSQDIEKLIASQRKKGEPLKIMFVGINGTGKTTTIAKVATYYIEKGYKPVIAASDTFRAGAIEQITHHADKIGVKIIKHKKGADPAAVAFDAVEHAKAQGKDLVLVDTAGRMQTNINLMDEMKKIQRVIQPDIILFVGDALTGNDAVEQARKFDDAVGVDGIVLTKADADAKGGAALSMGHVINKPILFLGTGQSYSDIMVFNPEWMVEQVFGE